MITTMTITITIVVIIIIITTTISITTIMTVPRCRRGLRDGLDGPAAAAVQEDDGSNNRNARSNIISSNSTHESDNMIDCNNDSNNASNNDSNNDSKVGWMGPQPPPFRKTSVWPGCLKSVTRESVMVVSW